MPVDTNKSYGYKITTDNNVVFDSGTNKKSIFDFDDTSLIDINKTTAVIEGLIDNGKIIHQVKIPQETTSNIDKSTRNYSPWAIKDSNGNIIGGGYGCKMSIGILVSIKTDIMKQDHNG